MTASPILPPCPAPASATTFHRAPAPAASRLSVEALSRRWEATVAGCPVAFRALEPVSLQAGRGEWVALVGAGDGGVTLLRCLAGLVRPDAGRIRWLDARGRPAPRPPLGMVHADQEHPRSHPVGRVVQAAAEREAGVRSGIGAAGAARAAARARVALACCGLQADRHREIGQLDGLGRWRVSVAVALAGGAEWLLLELPPLDASAAFTPAGHALRRMERALAGLGVGAIVAASGALPFRVARRIAVDGAAVGAMATGALAGGDRLRHAARGVRVAEGDVAPGARLRAGDVATPQRPA